MIQNNIFLKLIFSILITHTSAIAAEKCVEISEKQMSEWMGKESTFSHNDSEIGKSPL